MGIVYEGVIDVDQGWSWDVNQEGKCFVSHDASLNWPWFAGLCLYAAALGMTLTGWTREWVVRWLEFLRRTMERLRKRVRKRWGQRWPNGKDRNASGEIEQKGLISFVGKVMLQLVERVGSVVVFVVFWSFAQFIAVLSLGDGFYPLLLVAFVGFTVWSTYDIIDQVFQSSI